jgi:hypothetical protein
MLTTTKNRMRAQSSKGWSFNSCIMRYKHSRRTPTQLCSNKVSRIDFIGVGL